MVKIDSGGKEREWQLGSAQPGDRHGRRSATPEYEHARRARNPTFASVSPELGRAPAYGVRPARIAHQSGE